MVSTEKGSLATSAINLPKHNSNMIGNTETSEISPADIDGLRNHTQAAAI